MNFRALVPAASHGMPLRPDILFNSLQREVDRLFDDFGRSAGKTGLPLANLIPNTDVVETDKDIEITIELPGLERGDVEIAIDDHQLTIRGEKKVGDEQKNKNYHLTERAYGVFYRGFPLPPGVDESAIQATMSKGLLKVVIPKPAHPEPKKIEVKEAA
jgi:HSP20 family protein